MKKLEQLLDEKWPLDATKYENYDPYVLKSYRKAFTEGWLARENAQAEETEVAQMDAVLGICRQLIESENVPAAIKHFQTEMQCSEGEAIDTVGPESIFFKSVMELQQT